MSDLPQRTPAAPRRCLAGTAWVVLAALLAAVAPAGALAAFPGQNGRIAYQGTNNLGTMTPVGGDRQPSVEGTAIFASPAWSPDGTKIAFASNRDTNSTFEIYVVGPGGVTRLTTNSADDGAPSWSPDGSKIAFESDRDGHGELYVMNADGGNQSRLTFTILDSRAPSWSPDGSRIAFSRGPAGGNTDIWVTTADGGAPTQLTTDPAPETNPDWSPDGGSIVLQRGDTTLVTMRANGDVQTPLPIAGGGARPAWSPDGTKIAFDVNLEIHTVNADGGGEVSLTSAGTSSLVAQSPAWQRVVPATTGPPPPPAGPGPSGTGAPAAASVPGPSLGFVDADRDGVSPPLDCNDANPVIHPGAGDTPGDKIDQDCNGRDATFPLLDRRVAASLKTDIATNYTVFASLTVSPAQVGDVLTLTCKGRGCPWQRKTMRVKKAARRISLLRELRKARLRKGSVVQLRVTRPGSVGRVTTWSIRAPRSPTVARTCISPGAAKPAPCRA